MSEIWKDAPGYEGTYMVSNTGRIKSIRRLNRNRQVVHQDRVMSLTTSSKGYLMAHLYRDGKGAPALVHRLVLSAFKGPSPLQCNHINGDKKDNRLENLEWTTPRDNIHHAIAIGIYDFRGERHPRSTLSNADAVKIRELLKTPITQRAIAKQFGISEAVVSQIKHGKTWVSV
jgi:hypothetical protein